MQRHSAKWRVVRVWTLTAFVLNGCAVWDGAELSHGDGEWMNVAKPSTERVVFDSKNNELNQGSDSSSISNQQPEGGESNPAFVDRALEPSLWGDLKPGSQDQVRLQDEQKWLNGRLNALDRKLDFLRVQSLRRNRFRWEPILSPITRHDPLEQRLQLEKRTLKAREETVERELQKLRFEELIGTRQSAPGSGSSKGLIERIRKN